MLLVTWSIGDIGVGDCVDELCVDLSASVDCAVIWKLVSIYLRKTGSILLMDRSGEVISFNFSVGILVTEASDELPMCCRCSSDVRLTWLVSS